MSDARDDELHDLIEGGDIDRFIEFIDSLCHNDEWDMLVTTRDRCRKALERGKQLWGVAAHIEYRVALDGPDPLAAAMIEQGAGKFSFGPLPEVVALNHRWDELRDHLAAGPLRGVVAHERVLRGEDLHDEDIEDAQVFDIPLRLQAWEPTYALAEYEPDKAAFPAPEVPPLDTVALPGHSRIVREDDPEVVRALTGLVSAWTSESNGHAEATAVRGGPLEAIAALGLRTARVAPVPLEYAMAQMAWAAASGGAHGRRKGAANGRFTTW